MVINGEKKTIKDIMRQPVTIGEDATLHDVLEKMIEQKTNSILVIDENKKLIGLVNTGSVIAQIIPDYLEDDIIAAKFVTEEIFKEEVNKTRDVVVLDFMNDKPNTVKIDASIMEVAILALSKRQIRVPVVDDKNKVVGLLTRTEIKQMIGYYMGIDESFT